MRTKKNERVSPMKLNYELWLEEQLFDEETNTLFNEGITCFKAGAYMASLLFSYLGLQSLIKYRIVNSTRPVNYQQSEWDAKKNDIVYDDENWEKKVQELVKNKTKPIFSLSKDVYDQYFYWKDRRNDCAHAKGNYISYPHVEAFWMFVQSNSHKFVVNGGKESIIKQIQDHFDIRITPPGQEILPLISKIPLTVKKEEYKEILEKVKTLTSERNNPEKKAQTWYHLLNSKELNSHVVEYLIEEDKGIFSLELFRTIPSLIKYFNNEPEFIRRTWMEYSDYLDYYIFIDMLRNNLIPDDQLEELFSKMFNDVPTDVFGYDLWYIDQSIAEFDRNILKEKGFFDKFYHVAFNDRRIVHNFNWANRNKELVSYYIEHFGLDKEMTSAINNAFNTTYSPKHLKSEIIEYYDKKPEIKEKHHEFSIELNENSPKPIRLEDESDQDS